MKSAINRYKQPIFSTSARQVSMAEDAPHETCRFCDDHDRLPELLSSTSVSGINNVDIPASDAIIDCGRVHKTGV